jgi:hypothetical protein
MTTHAMDNAPSFPPDNPFCTRRIRPGALPYLFPPDMSWNAIMSQLKDAGGWGEIVGPHGSGKSTLLAGLIPLLAADGWRATRIDLHDGERRLPVDLRRIGRSGERLMLVVDGYEQLGSLRRLQLKRHCRRCGWGLIATAHRAVGLPELHNTAVSLDQAKQVVAELLKDHQFEVSEKDLEQRYAACAGNLREMLFGLYDLFERERQS